MPDDPPDHIGWTLWQVAQLWRKEFTTAMVASGHAWFGQARGNLLMHIGPNGLRQSDLVERSRLTKQAVQQFVDELVADGILMRIPDQNDARARWVCLTSDGEKAMRDADRLKVEIEWRWRRAIGSTDFDHLVNSLRNLIVTHGSILPPQPQNGKKG